MIVLHVFNCRICGTTVPDAELKAHLRMHAKDHFPNAFYTPAHLIVETDVVEEEVEPEPEPVEKIEPPKFKKPRGRPKIEEIEPESDDFLDDLAL